MFGINGKGIGMSIAYTLSGDRSQKLLGELSFALSRTDGTALKSWGGRSASTVVRIGAHRITALAGFVAGLGKGSLREIQDQFHAWQNGHGGEHFGNRTAAAIDGTITFAKDASRTVKSIGKALHDDPATNAPKVMAAFLGFYAGSGGVDGNGGIPDLDLLMGIDAHRSLLTHSIIAGILAEGMLLAAADLAWVVHERLPYDHDPLWDKLAEKAAPLNEALITGTSAGIAYHLLVDAGIQPAPYHDLPFSMPMEAHQGVMGANGLAEGAHAATRHKNGPAETLQGNEQRKSTGRAVVDTVANVFDQTGKAGKGFWASVKKGYTEAEAKRKARNADRYTRPRTNDDDNPAYQAWRPDASE